MSLRAARKPWLDYRAEALLRITGSEFTFGIKVVTFAEQNLVLEREVMKMDVEDPSWVHCQLSNYFILQFLSNFLEPLILWQPDNQGTFLQHQTHYPFIPFPLLYLNVIL